MGEEVYYGDQYYGSQYYGDQYYPEQYYGGAQQYGGQEVSQLSEISPSTAQLTEEKRENRTWMMVIILCAAIIILFFLVVFLLVTTLVFTDESKTKDGDEEYTVYPSDVILPAVSPASTPSATTPAVATPSTKASTVPIRTTTGTTTTTEDTETFVANYSNPIYPDTHQYICIFNASTQGMRMFHRVFGIGLFPYIYCHIAVYCCYTMDSNFDLIPERPQVDLLPRDAVRRMADFKQDNKFLSVFLGLRGDHRDFTRLVKNDSGEQGVLVRNIEQWSKINNYDGVRFLWQFPEVGQKQPMIEMGLYMTDYLMPQFLSIGFFVPNERHLSGGFDPYRLALMLGVNATIIGYPAEDIALPPVVTWYATTKNQIKDTFSVIAERVTLNVTTSVCYPFAAARSLSFTLTSPCTNASSRLAVNSWGSPGPYTKTPGRLSVSEVCAEVDSTWYIHKRKFYTVACKDTRAIAYLDDTNAGNVLKSLHDSYVLGCFGLLQHELDDYANKCNFQTKGLYPLLRRSWTYYKDAIPHGG